ncbi:MAG: L,D-transpeptidase family protein [Pseudolabrys sp.]
MRNVRFDRLMTSTALALLLAGSTALAGPRDDTASQRHSNEQGPIRRNVGTMLPPPAAAPAVRRDSGAMIMTIPPHAARANAQATSDEARAPIPNSRPLIAPAPQPALIPASAPAAVAPMPAPAPARAPVQASAPVAAPTPAPVAAPAAAAPLPDHRSPLDRLVASSPQIPDAQVSEKLRAAKFASRVPNAQDRKAIEAAYASQNYAPMWFKDGAPTDRAKTVIERLKNVAADGFEVSEYPVPDLGTISSADALASADIQLTNSVVTYARHLESGRIAPTRVTAEADYGSGAAPADPAEILKRIGGTGNINAALDHYNPQHPGFRALRAKLAEVRSHAANDQTRYIPEGGVIKPGLKDPRIPMIRAKLGVPGKADDTTYDKALVFAVKKYQKANDLVDGGIIGNITIAKMNGPKASEQLLAVLGSLERWRWLPRDLGRNYVMINIPDYTLRVVSNNNLVWKTNIVVGKPQTPTPLLTATMDHVLVNPSWYVPQSIIQNELLPAYEKDPRVFERMGLEVRKGPDGHINVVQPPGAANALGHIKFAFPNKYQVYLHDTPEKRLFAASDRAFSHGCMRVENPTKFGEVILSLAMSGPAPNQRQLDQMYGQDEKMFKLANRPMVHLTYQTAYVDDAGKLVGRKDIYGYDSRVHTILTSDERKIADQPPPQDKTRDLATAKSNQEVLRRVERREAKNPFDFFERIFR